MIRVHDPHGDDDLGTINMARSDRHDAIEHVRRFLREQQHQVEMSRARLHDHEDPPSPEEVGRLQAGIEYWGRRYQVVAQALHELEIGNPPN